MNDRSARKSTSTGSTCSGFGRQLYRNKNDTLCGPRGGASIGSTPGLVDPLEAPPPGPRVLGSESNCKGTKAILYVDPVGGPPQGQQPDTVVTHWMILDRFENRETDDSEI